MDAINCSRGSDTIDSIESLRLFLGYRQMRMDRFRKLLRQAGKELEGIGFLTSFAIRNELATGRVIVSWVRERQYESCR